MSKINLETAKCDKCGLCVKDCPGFVISFGASGFPEIPETRKTSCIRCGHCEAICPKGALALQFRPAEKRNEKPVTSHILPAKLEEFLRYRRSIRNFKKGTVPQADIDAIFDNLRYAPTGGNSQGVKWTVINGHTEVRKFSGLAIEWMAYLKENDPEAKLKFSVDDFISAYDKGNDLICRNAPHLAVNYFHSLNGSGFTDCIIALTQFELLCASRGIGTCWGGFFVIAAKSWKPLINALEIPEDHAVGFAMMFGYPSVTYSEVPRRKPLQVKYLGTAPTFPAKD